MIFDNILICTDLDGTLLLPDGSISRENTEAIAYFQREGGRFTFITGRMPYYADHVARMIRPNAPFGCANGGGLYDHSRGEYVFRAAPLAPDVCELIAAVEAGVPNIGIQLAGFEHSYFSQDNEATAIFRAETNIPHLTCPYTAPPEPIIKILFSGDDDQIECTAAVLSAHPLANAFTLVPSERYLFEILPKPVSKGLAIEALCAHYGIDRARSIAIGDYNNDIPMLRAAGLGVAVANACPDALAAADVVTVANTEHAIARVIADIESGKLPL